MSTSWGGVNSCCFPLHFLGVFGNLCYHQHRADRELWYTLYLQLETAFPFPVSISVPPVFLDIGLVRVLKRWPGAKIASHRGKQDRNEHLFTMEKDFHSLLGGAVTDLLLSSRSLLLFCWPMWRRSNRDWSALGSKEAIGSALEVSSQLPSAVLSLLSLLCTFSQWAKTLQRKKVLALLCFNF